MANKTSASILVTVEHGGNGVPKVYRPLFEGRDAQRLLMSHRGYDPGSLHLGRYLARTFDAPLVTNTVTRLLVDLNRSVHNKSLFSEFTRPLGLTEKRLILERVYIPHRHDVHEALDKLMHNRRRETRVIHLGVHSFTPVLDGKKRTTDLGLLYDPHRQLEREFSQRWKQALTDIAPTLRVRMNDPYRGKSDGLTTSLRRYYAPDRYMGIELEVNQARLQNPTRFPPSLVRVIVDSLHWAVDLRSTSRLFSAPSATSAVKCSHVRRAGYSSGHRAMKR
ncbi:MAG: N-formylglutamate amidohydrolase [Phycisphaera sp.]|nr:N-formylglutamate amidohydrolase [Phycisphaera sp.]